MNLPPRWVEPQLGTLMPVTYVIGLQTDWLQDREEEGKTMAVREITKDTSVAEIVKLCPGARRIFDEHGLKGCGGEHGPSEPLAFFAAVHQADLEELLREINAEMQSPSRGAYVYNESLLAAKRRPTSMPVSFPVPVR